MRKRKKPPELIEGQESYKMTQMQTGDAAEVFLITCGDDLRQRFAEIGLVTGTRVTCVLRSAAGDPTAYIIRGAVIALRNEDSDTIAVKTLNIHTKT